MHLTRDRDRADEDGGSSWSRSSEQLQIYDPLADLLFSLVAVVIIGLLSQLPKTGSRQAADLQSFLESQITYKAAKVEPVIAMRNGVRFGSHQATTVGLDSIIGDKKLASFLLQADRHRESVLEIILPDGLEAAFELEHVLSSYISGPVLEMRLSPDCAIKTEKSDFNLCARSPVRSDEAHG